MKICELSGYGVFDTDVAFPGKKRSSQRCLTKFEIEYYISATGHAIVNDRAYEISPGTVLCCKPGQMRSSIFGFRCYYLHILFPTESPYIQLLEKTPDYFQIIDSETYEKLFESLILHLLNEGYDPESDYVNARLLELLYYLNRDTRNNLNCPEQFDKNRYRFIPQVLDFIRKNCHKQLTLKDMADVARYSPCHFHHVFTAVMGKTPQECLMEERIRRAKWLLIQTEKPLSEIAYECGFSSQSHLCARFKKMTFSTPGEYRRRNLDNYRL